MRHLVSIDDITPLAYQHIMKRAAAIKDADAHFGGRPLQTLRDRILATVFYEPSTRTRLSFESAMFRIGGNVIGTENAAQFSSAVKGESIADTFQIISGYADIIVGRFKNEGEAEVAAANSRVPVINGGDGKGEHPTQALTDLFTIIEKFPENRKDAHKLHIVFMGDNLHSRTVQSLAKLLARFDMIDRMTFVGPEVLNFDPDDKTGFLHRLRDIHLEYGHADGTLGFLCVPTLTPEIIGTADIVYVTRAQAERHEGYVVRLEDMVTLTPELALQLPVDAIILHPLPRNQELPVEVDGNLRSCYFEQARNGVPVRMALLEGLCLGYL